MPAQWHLLGAFLRTCNEINPFVRRVRRSRSSAEQVRTIEHLEERRLLTTVFWNTDSNGFWDDAANWSTGQVPSSGDDVTIDRGAANPVITIRDARTINTLLDREAVIVSSGSLQVNTSTDIDATTFTLREGAALTLLGSSIINSTATFSWEGGNFFGQATANSGSININSNTDVRFGGTLTNFVQIIQSGSSAVLLDGSAKIINKSTGQYQFNGAGDLGVSNVGGGSAPLFQNEGTLRKSFGAESKIDGLQLNNSSTGTFVAANGKLNLASSGTWSGGTLNALGTAVVEISGSYAIEGTFTGAGESHVELTGSLTTTGAATTFNFPTGLFQWKSGVLGGGGSGLTNNGSITVAPTTTVRLAGLLTNNGTIIQTGEGKLQFDGSTQLLNAATGVYDIQGNGDIDRSDFGAGFAPFFQNNGILRKSSGTGTSTIEEIDLNGGANAILDVQAGRIKAVSNGTWAGASFTGAAGGVFEINGTIGIQGTVTGIGGGQLELTGNLNAAAGTTLNFAGSSFQWLAGSISGGGSGVTNIGTITVAGNSDKIASGRLNISGTVNHIGTGRLLINNSSVVTITETGLYDFKGDGGWGRSSQGGGFSPFFEIRGTLRKSGGSGISLLDGQGDHFSVNLVDGKIDVQTGRLLLDEPGQWQGAEIHVTAGAVFEMSGDSGLAMTGLIKGSGEGRVELNTSIASADFGISGSQATLDFPEGQFYWMSGLIGSVGGGGSSGNSNTMINAGYITIDGADAKGVFGSSLSNAGTIVNIGSGDFNTNGYNLTNQAGALFEIRSNSQFNGTDQFGNPGRFFNSGEFRKTTDAGTVTYSGRFDNTATGSIDVTAGRLKLSRGGDLSGGVFEVGPAAVLEFAGVDQFNMSGTFTGTGPGIVAFNAPLNGGDQANPAVLDFPEDMFQFQGGLNFGFGGNIVNDGWFYFASPIGQSARAGFTNNGTWVHSGAGDFVLNANSRFFNQGVYDLQTDADLLVPGDQSGGAMVFTNVGTFIKSGGTGLSSFRHDGSNKEFRLDNLGTIDVRTGTLSINDTVVQRVGTTLAAGTWKVGANATLTMPGGGNFTVNQANVELYGVGATFPNLTPLASNTGSLTLDHGLDFNTVGDLTNTGNITLGAGSVLTVSGNYTQTGGTSSLREIIGGRPNTGLFGKLVATGQASLAGRLIFSLASGFGPSLGDQYQVLQYGSKVGDFGLIAGLPPFFTADVQATQTLLTAIGEGTNISTQSVTPPANGTVGQNATISYTVQNNSDDAITGDWTDSVYLSRDSIFSEDDVLFARVPHLGGLAANGSYIGTANGLVPNVIDGDYHVIVVADTSLDVPDTNRADNTRASTGVVHVTVPALAFNTPINNTIVNGQEKLFRLDIPSGSDVLLFADFAVSIQAEVLIGFGRIPSPGHFDYAALDLNDLNREILISNPQAGPYYVLIRGREGANTAQSFSLSARQAGFEVRSIGPNHGSNAGQTTITVTGSGFTPDSIVKLIAPNSTVTTATSVIYRDSNTLFATFNLAGLPATAGYDVRVENSPQSTATTNDLFTVTAGAAAKLQLRLLVPQFIRPNVEGQIQVEYFNTGETDAAAPLILIRADNAKLKLPGQIGFADNNLEILGINYNGPAGILPAGARGIATIVFKPDAAGQHIDTNFTASIVGADVELDWSLVKNDFRPPATPTDAWDTIYANFVTRVGTTAGQQAAVLAANATYLSQFGEYINDPVRLRSYELQKADAFGAITDHYTFGMFGRNQFDGYNIHTITESTGDVNVVLSTGVRRFEKLTATTFKSPDGDSGILSRAADGTLHLLEINGDDIYFNSNGSLNSIKQANGNRIAANYTAGLLSSLVHTNGDRINFTYNGSNKATQITDSYGHVTTYTYDGSNQHLLTKTDAAGTTTYTYVTGQGANREHAIASITYPGGQVINYEYDAQGRLTRETQNGGAQAVTYAYDANGVITITDKLGNKTKIYPDDNGGVARLITPTGQVFNVGRDFNTTLLSDLIGPLGYHLSVDRDAQGNPTTITDALGRVLSFTYSFGPTNFASYTDQLGNTTHYTADNSGNITSQTDAQGHTIQYEYDTRGNVIKSVDPDGRTATATYNAQNELTRLEYSDGRVFEYANDIHGNVTAILDGDALTVVTYDAAERVTRVDYSNGRWVAYTYNTAGLRTSMTTQDGFEVHYEYDALQHLTRVSDANDATLTLFTYDAIGRVSTKTYGNGATTTYGYNGNGQVTSIVHRNQSNAILARFDYVYDALGRPVKMTTLDGETNYVYDLSSQLIEVDLPGGRIIKYDYDAAGNRISVTDNGVETDYTVNTLNQYTSSGNATFTYDNNGNLLTRTDLSGVTTYGYDAANRLKTVTSTTDTWVYEYDALGNRIATTHNGQRTEYLVDSVGESGLGDVIGEYNSVGTLVANYAHAGGLLSRVAGGIDDYYHFDASGNTAALTGAGGAVLNSYQYLPFGEQLSSTGSTPNPFTFVGQAGVTDEGNGLYFMRNRFYDSTTGRFTQQDPIGLSGGDGNVYRYVGNSPVLLIDPVGLDGSSPGNSNQSNSSGSNTNGDLSSVAEAHSRLDTLLGPRGDANEGLYTAKETENGESFLDGFAGKFGFDRRPNLPQNNQPPNPRSLNEKLKEYLERKNPEIKGKTREASDTPLISYRESIPQRAADSMEFYIRLGYTVEEAYENTKPLLKEDGKTSQIASGDPNDILGPPLYVRNDETLPYTIRFENMPTASAPALEVIVTQTLDSDLDLSTFELGDIGFGDVLVDVPAGLNSFTTRVTMPAADNIGGAALYVDITASLNFVTRVVTWHFNTIDPLTGDIPANPLAGFLPPNTNAPEGNGFVGYSVRPNAGLQTGIVIDSEARIVFDTNDPIDTPHITNTIDNGVPTSSVNALTPTQDFPSFQVSWSGTDDANGPTGSGIAFYDVYVSDDGGDFVPFLLGTTQTSAVFTGQVNHTYRFYSVATDNVGFQQAPVNAGQTSTQVLDVLFDFGDAPDPFFNTAGKYPTLLANDGARHKLGSGLYLGSGVDREFDGQPTATADGDDVAGVPDDENGVVFASLIRGTTGSATVTSSQAGKLDAWIDFNRDGDWDDPGEQVATSLSVNAGSNNVSLVVPAGALTGNTFARFRLSSAGGLGVTGAANDGEVEDYQVTIGSPLISNSGGAVTWTKKDPPVSVLPLVSVPSSNLANGTLTISMNSTGSKKKSVDLLVIPSFAGTSSSLVPVYSGGNRLTLTLQLNGSVTANDIQTFLRNIKFSTKGKGLNLSPRTMTVTLENSSGASSTVSQTINVVKKAPRPPR